MISVLFIHRPEFLYQTEALIETIERTEGMRARLCTDWNDSDLDTLIGEEVDCVVTIHSRQKLIGGIIDYCQRHAITTVTLQDGIIDYKHWNIVAPERYRPLLSDYIFCFGEHSRELLLERGVPDARIVVTGTPRFDLYDREKREGAYILVTTANTPYHTFFEKLKLFFQLAGLIGWFRLKRAPFHLRFPKKLQKSWSFRLLLKMQQDRAEYGLMEDLSNATLVYTTMSTVAIESLCLGKPVVLIRNDTFPKYMRTPVEIAEWLPGIQSSPPLELPFEGRYRELLKHQVSHLGAASRVIVRTLREIAAEKDAATKEMA